MEDIEKLQRLLDRAYTIMVESNKLELMESLKEKLEAGEDPGDVLAVAFVFGFLANTDIHIRNIQRKIKFKDTEMDFEEYIEKVQETLLA